MNDQNNSENNQEINESKINSVNADTSENIQENQTAESTGEAQEKEEDGSEKKEKSFFDDLMEVFESVFISVFFVLLIFTFVARPVTVDGRSMYPTLEDQDKLIMNTLFFSPDPGDIIVIDNHTSYTFEQGTDKIIEGTSLDKRLIKRVIAVGGQTIDIDFDAGIVTVDGKIYEEDYISEATAYNPGAFSYPLTIPEGYVFVMGDNRNNSTDSRDNHVGLVKEEDIMGEALFRFYPFDKFKLLD